MRLYDPFGGGASAPTMPVPTPNNINAAPNYGNHLPSIIDNLAVAHQTAQQAAQQAAYNSQISALGRYPSVGGRKFTTIEIEETSNGSIIRIGDVTRICPTDGVLMDQVAAAYTESKLK